jgi:salicylate biosynthesis isochorismate synthase/menaquinone-specific isochorismate synthase
VASRTLPEPPRVLTPDDQDRLQLCLTTAVRRARRGGEPVLASITVPLGHGADPSELAVASRRPGEPWFLLEQPDHGGAALAALGAVIELEASGPGRFTELAARWRALGATAEADDPVAPGATGPVAVGGFSFADDGGRSPTWEGFAPASLVVPEVSIARGERDGERQTHLTLTALATPDDVPDELQQRLLGRVGELRRAPLPLLDPAPAGRFDVSSVMPPEHYEHAVARAVQAIRGGELEKIVLAREVLVRAPGAYDPAAVFGVLREAFPACFSLCVGRGDATLIAASPELLMRREGLRASTLALAGSTRRSADPAVDDHLGEQLLRSDKDRAEQAIVARRIERTLRPHALWVTAAPEPTLARVANIQHLATPIRAQLARPIDAIELVGLMHPTPAVGGEPFAVAEPLIPALEGLDRGWYAGPVGWSDRHGDGEFCVALRCALLRGREARCYAGVGVVAESDPAGELAETEIKLAALLPVLAG